MENYRISVEELLHKGIQARLIRSDVPDDETPTPESDILAGRPVGKRSRSTGKRTLLLGSASAVGLRPKSAGSVGSQDLLPKSRPPSAGQRPASRSRPIANGVAGSKRAALHGGTKASNPSSVRRSRPTSASGQAGLQKSGRDSPVDGVLPAALPVGIAGDLPVARCRGLAECGKADPGADNEADEAAAHLLRVASSRKEAAAVADSLRLLFNAYCIKYDKTEALRLTQDKLARIQKKSDAHAEAESEGLEEAPVHTVAGSCTEALEALRREVGKMQARQDQAMPLLAEARQLVADLQTRALQLRDELQALTHARTHASSQAAEEVGQLSKKELSEIKSLTRTPPDSIKRTFDALYLLLYCKKWRGQSRISFDSVKEWPRCQRMLADEGFIANILEFDPATLDEIPQVPLYIASNYFGLSVDEKPESIVNRATRKLGDLVRHSSLPEICDSESLPSEPGIRRQRSVGCVQLKRRSLPSGMSREMSRLQLKPTLEVSAVSRACEACGPLLRWIQELVSTFMKRRRLQQDLDTVNVDIFVACERLSMAERNAAQLNEDLIKASADLMNGELEAERLLDMRARADKAKALEVLHADLSREITMRQVSNFHKLNGLIGL